MNYAEVKPRLARSAFRSRFQLTDRDRACIADHGWAAIAHQARAIILARLAMAEPPHDGRQTPMRGHVVFVAQHATGCCCRGCLAKWHGIPRRRALTEPEVEAVVKLLCDWLRDAAGDLSGFSHTPDLFEP